MNYVNSHCTNLLFIQQRFTINNFKFIWKQRRKSNNLTQYLIDLQRKIINSNLFFFFYTARLSNHVAKVANSNLVYPYPSSFNKGELYNEPVVKVQLSSSEKGTRFDWWRSMHENVYINSSLVFVTAPRHQTHRTLEPISIRDIFSHKLCSLNVALLFPPPSNPILGHEFNTMHHREEEANLHAKSFDIPGENCDPINRIGSGSRYGPRIRPIARERKRERHCSRYIDICIYLFDTVVGGTRV